MRSERSSNFKLALKVLILGSWLLVLDTHYSILFNKKTSIKYLIYGDKEYFCKPKNALQKELKLLI
jgi:phosphomevalonate kinase